MNLTQNQSAFRAALVAAYSDLFKTNPDYAYSASKPRGRQTRPSEMVSPALLFHRNARQSLTRNKLNLSTVNKTKPIKSPMKTEAVLINPPESLIAEVRHLKAHFPYRVCWGAFNTLKTSEQLTGANYDKRRFNKAIRQPSWAGFCL